MIGNLQVLRAFTALAVVLHHTSYPLINGRSSDFQGVAIFFVISGFIMSYVVLKDDKQSKADKFLLHRFVRLVPFYWLCVVAFIYLSNLGLLNLSQTLPRLGALLANDWLGALRWVASGFNLTINYSIQEIVKTLFFIPYKDVNGDYHPILGVGWTLNLEVYFFIIFALTLLGKKAYAPIIIAVIITIGHLEKLM